MEKLDKEYWANRYKTNDTGWDVGDISTPLKEYIDSLEDKSISILVPGAGNAYEVEYLFYIGFKNVFLLDIAEEPIENFKKRVPNFPKEQLIVGDFFEQKGQYDLIIEQTFFCALNPTLRKNYVSKMSELLKQNGKLIGLLFNIPLNDEKPPFGGNKEEYSKLFEPSLSIIEMEQAKNSIKPRENNELFFICSKDKHSSTKS
ncbi:MAG: methyltransferase domain-containing protein [Bacteroidetes bacterium]|nr:methyltransferase domain-containing protein [Bacteroidota bacterium]